MSFYELKIFQIYIVLFNVTYLLYLKSIQSFKGPFLIPMSKSIGVYYIILYIYSTGIESRWSSNDLKYSYFFENYEIAYFIVFYTSPTRLSTLFLFIWGWPP